MPGYHGPDRDYNYKPPPKKPTRNTKMPKEVEWARKQGWKGHYPCAGRCGAYTDQEFKEILYRTEQPLSNTEAELDGIDPILPLGHPIGRNEYEKRKNPHTVGELLQSLPDLRKHYKSEPEQRLSDEPLKGPTSTVLIMYLLFGIPISIVIANMWLI